MSCGRLGSIIVVTDENRAALVRALGELKLSQRVLLQRAEQSPVQVEFAGYRFTFSNEREFLELVQVLEERVVRGTGRTTAALKLVLECERRGETVFYVLNYEQIPYVENLYRGLGGNPRKVRFVPPQQLRKRGVGIIARVFVDHCIRERLMRLSSGSTEYRETREALEIAALMNERANSKLGPPV